MSDVLVPGYCLRVGSEHDRALLVKFMQRTYTELYPGENLTHLERTVEQYFSSETPVWWVEPLETSAEMFEVEDGFPSSRVRLRSIACLWLGNAIDQATGQNHAYIFLLYVMPEHRRRGIGSALVRYAESWALSRGDRQIGLQVFVRNQPAIQLYERLGYQTQSLWMVKSLK